MKSIQKQNHLLLSKLFDPTIIISDGIILQQKSLLKLKI